MMKAFSQADARYRSEPRWETDEISEFNQFWMAICNYLPLAKILKQKK
jgi:hypothetical protein